MIFLTKLYFIIFIFLISCNSSNKYAIGSCIQTPDMTVWKVVKVDSGSYLAARLKGKSWLEAQKLSYNILDGSEKFKINCPNIN